MPQNKRNEAAIQLWEQIFLSMAKCPDAALWNPNYDPAEDKAKGDEGFKQAGWSDEEILSRNEEMNAFTSNASATNLMVNPYAQAQFAKLCDDVEAAMDRLKLSSYASVARGIEPRLGPYAAKTNVIMTDESIITVGAHTFRFCGLVARAFARTLRLNPFIWESDDYDEAVARQYLRTSPDLVKYWLRIYLSYALTGTNVLVPFRPATKTELLLFEQVARAMEIFAISHEYGHHNFNHREVGKDAYQEEFEADQFALKICYEVERSPIIFENPYLSSGAGGAILLLALQTLSEVEGLVVGRKGPTFDTHPSVASRIQRFRLCCRS